MVDLRIAIMTQKLKWIKLLLNNHGCLWIPLMEAIINVGNLNVFLRSNYDVYSVCVNSRFYSDVLKSLYELNKVDINSSETNIRNQFIFYNKFMKLDGRMIFDKELFSAGLWQISDLFKPGGTAIPFCDWKTRGVSKSKYMVWRGLLEKVRAFKSDIKPGEGIRPNRIILLPTNDNIDIQMTTSKELYCKIIKLKREKPKSLEKYENRFSLETEDFENVFVIPRVCVKNNLIKEFQYKVLHRYLPTNDLLYKMKKIESNKCTFCHLYAENITHVLFACICVRDLWNRVERILTYLENNNVKLAGNDVILGYKLRQNPFSNIFVNNIILHVKYFIWKSKLMSVNPSYARLKEFIGCNIIYEQCMEVFYGLM